MAFLKNMSDRFWTYVSPRKTQQRRDKLFRSPPPLPTPATIKKGRLLHHEMSPSARVTNWTIKTPQKGTIGESEVPPSPPKSLERTYTDFDGDTLIDDIVQVINPDQEAAYDANEDTIVVDEGTYQDQQKDFDPELERERREIQGRELRAAGWPADAIFLFQKLGMRGFEPLLPHSWSTDFVALPLDLFTRNLDKAFVKPNFGSDWHGAYLPCLQCTQSIQSESDILKAQIALSNLFMIGGRARDAVLQEAPERTAEKQICRAVHHYYKWAVKDGCVDALAKGISLFESISLPKHVHSSVLQEKMLRKLGTLADKWQKALQARQLQHPGSHTGKSPLDYDSIPEIPTLYGVIASHTIMAFVSFDPLAPTPSLRTVAIFDFGQEGYDVWNSLAIAIFIIHCRNRLMELQEFVPEPLPRTKDDPDR